MSSRTLQSIQDALCLIFSGAKEFGIITDLPITRNKKRVKSPKRTVWSYDMLRNAMMQIKDPVLHLAVHLTFICTLRNGEVGGITLANVHIKDKYIYMDKQLQRTFKEALDLLQPNNVYYVFPQKMASQKTCLILKPPKTEASIRNVYLSEPLALEIVDQLNRISVNKRRLGEDYHDYSLLIFQENGDPIEPNLLYNKFKKWQQSLEDKYPEVDFHSLRHASTTFKYGIDQNVKTLQGELGDSSADVLLNTYAHAEEGNRKTLSQKVEKKFYGNQIHQKDNMDSFLNTVLKNPDLQQKLMLALLAKTAGVSSGEK